MLLFVQIAEWLKKQHVLYKISTVTKLSVTLHIVQNFFMWFGSLVSKFDFILQSCWAFIALSTIFSRTFVFLLQRQFWTSSVKKQALGSDLFSGRQLMQSNTNTPKSLPCVQTPHQLTACNGPHKNLLSCNKWLTWDHFYRSSCFFHLNWHLQTSMHQSV